MGEGIYIEAGHAYKIENNVVRLKPAKEVTMKVSERDLKKLIGICEIFNISYNIKKSS